MFTQDRSDGGLRLVTSASDLTAASTCEFAFLRKVDEKLGRNLTVPDIEDPMMRQAATLGDAHEARVLNQYRDRLGDGVVEIERPASYDADGLRVRAEETARALHGGTALVFQATFFDEGSPVGDDLSIAFVGFADFLQRVDDGGSFAYEVQDTKLARRAKVTALLQLAAYAEQLERIGVSVAPTATLILGDGTRTEHRIDDIAPVYRSRRARLHEILIERASARGADGRRETAEPIPWGAPDVQACGSCEVCMPEVTRTRDPLLIAGIRRVQRDRLVAAGFTTIDAVAGLEGRRDVTIDRMAPSILERLVLQAAVQIESEGRAVPSFRVVSPEALAAIPEPNEGDLFFDFEGNPFHHETVDGRTRWDLDYLFGMIDAQEQFTPIWAHTLAEERRALETFIALVNERRERYPGLKIYHYASYERTHLLSIASRHGVCENEVDDLLRHHVLVDLFPIVKQALIVGSHSYSIKKLEPLYMGDELRDADGVTDGGQSVVEYERASVLLRSDSESERAEGQRALDAIADYNRYDCVSTLRLRDWLLGLARDRGIASHGPAPALVDAAEAGDDGADPEPELELSRTAKRLLEHATHTDDPDLRQAAALASSAIDYHEREQKSFWWHHYARLEEPIEEWADTRDVIIVDSVRSVVETDWHRPPKARTDRRALRIRGEIAPGSHFREGGDVFLAYAHPAPFADLHGRPGARSVRQVRVLERHDDGITVQETLARDAEPYEVVPVAVTPGPPPRADQPKAAIEEWGIGFADALDSGQLPDDPVVDLLLRRPPALSTPLDVLAEQYADTIDRVTAAIRSLERSSIAVQGPPGTGKTYLASHVIRRLVEEDGWHVGIVAQSHRVVENVLEGVVKAGLSPRQVGKTPQGGRLASGEPEPPYTVLPSNGQARFIDELRAAGRGSVTGGTVWDLSHPNRFERRSLDLLVIDEAGQFSLAPTIAASVSAERLLLLGDPQQLPQVSQGSHPEPVDTSALAWLLGTHETMPSGLGFFLAETRRMHADLARVVSELFYEGRLDAHESTTERHVMGSEHGEHTAGGIEIARPGLTWHPVSHTGNSTSSVEEAARVVEIVRAALTGQVTHHATESETSPGPRTEAITQRDVIVVAAYNAQVECLSLALAEAGYDEVRVGTVDKFQGQEALIAIVSLAASSLDDVPRGIEFLLMPNRLNVAISRAQWAAHLVSSDRLGAGLPGSPEGILMLSRYLRLTEVG